MAKDVRFDIKAQNKTDRAFSAVDRNLKGLTKGLGGLKGLAVGAAAITGGMYALAKGVETVTKAATVQRKAESELNAVLEATGHAAGYNIEQLKQMASAFQNVTTYGDEAILSGQAILATFKNVRGEAFERATAAALDMSTVMKQDLKSSMIQLGKALNDPVKGLTALSRVGIQFTDQQKEQIAALQESGDLMGAQKLILEELESQFGGAAEAAGGPWNKALKQLSNTWGDLLEQIGFAITDNQVFVQLLQRAKAVVESWIPKVGELAKKFMDWLGPIESVEEKISIFMETVRALLWPLKQLVSLFNAVGKFLGQGAAMVYTAGENLINKGHRAMGSFQTGTGPQGLPRDGLYYGHKGEIVHSQGESASMRAAGGGGINVTFAPMFMTGDKSSMREAASALKQELSTLNSRLGG